MTNNVQRMILKGKDEHYVTINKLILNFAVPNISNLENISQKDRTQIDYCHSTYEYVYIKK